MASRKGFTESYLRRVVRRLEDEGVTQSVIGKIVCAVPFKRGAGPSRQEVAEVIADQDGMSKAQVLRDCAGCEVGVYVRLVDLISGYYVIQGDQCFIRDDGSTVHGRDVVTFGPEQLALSRGWFIDENVEGHRSEQTLVDEVHGLRHGGSSRWRRY